MRSPHRVDKLTLLASDCFADDYPDDGIVNEQRTQSEARKAL